MASRSASLFAFLVGASFGATLAVLYAPDKGEVTRERLKKRAEELQAEANARLKSINANLQERATQQREVLGKHLETGLSKASYKAEDLILALEAKLAELRQANKRYQRPRATEPS